MTVLDRGRRWVAGLVFLLAVCIPVAQAAHGSAQPSGPSVITSARSHAIDTTALVAPAVYRQAPSTLTSSDVAPPPAAFRPRVVRGAVRHPGVAAQLHEGLRTPHPVRGPPDATVSPTETIVT